MKSYRITKYNPVYREDGGGYTKDEWTSCSDVGSIYEGKIFTQAEYDLVEAHYLNVVKAIFEETKQKNVTIQKLENYEGLQWLNKQKLDLMQVESFCRDCLQERCWGKLQGKKFFVHFGYDYYMYIGTDLPKEKVEKIANDNDLFCEEFKSPHE